MKNKRLIERRQYMQKLRGLRDQDIIKVITGVRRCGKSTLLQMFADELATQGVAQKQIQFYNFEDLETLALGDIFQIHTHVKNKLVAGKMNYIFLDEVQNVKDFQRLVDSLFIKDNCDVYITGSNAHLLSGELATLLSGRYITIEVLPFSYAEYIEFLTLYPPQPEDAPEGGENSKLPKLSKNESFGNLQNGAFHAPATAEKGAKSKLPKLLKKESFGNLQKNDVFSTVKTQDDAKAKFLNLLKKESFGNLAKGGVLSPTMAMHWNYFDFQYDGGIPHAVGMGADNQEQSKGFLQSVLDTIIEKDIYKRHEVYTQDTFRKLVDFLMDSIGSLISPSSIANVLRSENMLVSHKTISQYLDYLTSSFLFYKVPRYDLKGKGLLRTLDKYYLSDTGFRKARLAKRKTVDLGHMLENVVYLELRRRYIHVYVGKWNGHEVDFVAIDRDQNMAYYQVAFTTATMKTLDRELAPLNAIRDSNPKFLLTMDIDYNPVYNGIRKLNVADWLLAKSK